MPNWRRSSEATRGGWRWTADEIFVGGREKSALGRQTGTKSIVAAAVENNRRGGERIRLRRAGDVSAAGLLSYVKDAGTPST